MVVEVATAISVFHTNYYSTTNSQLTETVIAPGKDAQGHVNEPLRCSGYTVLSSSAQSVT
jgi:hypothetical protein